jgi:CheY-like chemotaxis protein
VEEKQQAERQETSSSQSVNTAKTGQWKVLVVEDDLSLKPFWEFLIKKNWPQAELEWAVSGERASQLLKSTVRFPPFDLIVSDVFLSGALTGIDIARLAYSSEWKHNCEVVLSSACNTKQLRVHMAQLEVMAKVLTKPYDVNVCVEMIASAIDRLKRKQGGWIDT